MKNIFKKNRKKNSIQIVGITLTSFMLGLGINMFLFNDTNISNNLKTNINESVVNSVVNKVRSDLYIEKNNDIYFIKVGKNMDSVENISFSIAYNGNNINILSMISTNNNIDIMNLSNYSGINTIVLNLEKILDIKKGDDIINFKISKENQENESINIINANFTDSEGETYLLSTSGIEL